MVAPDLVTPNSHLRALRLDDAPALFPAFADEANMRFWSQPPHKDIGETEADIRWWLETNPMTAWAILGSNGAVAGRTGLMILREGVGEFGVALRPDAAGKGLARGAIAAISDYAFTALGLHRLVADIDPDNVASRRLFEACGFIEEATLKQNWKTHIGLRDSVIYARLRDG
jgi:RimJ/RimL family protein N-acetyltransferase